MASAASLAHAAMDLGSEAPRSPSLPTSKPEVQPPAASAAAGCKRTAAKLSIPPSSSGEGKAKAAADPDAPDTSDQQSKKAKKDDVAAKAKEMRAAEASMTKCIADLQSCLLQSNEIFSNVDKNSAWKWLAHTPQYQTLKDELTKVETAKMAYPLVATLLLNGNKLGPLTLVLRSCTHGMLGQTDMQTDAHRHIDRQIDR